MNTYIALFRGINVGGNHILPMKELAQLLQGLAFEQVQTYIQSGNVVFRATGQTPAAIGQAIRNAVKAQFGFDAKVLVLLRDELARVVANNPYPTEVGKALHCYFLEATPEAIDLPRLAALQGPLEQFQLSEPVFYLYAPEGIGRSKLAPAVEKCLGVAATARNWNTVAKLMQMADGGDGMTP